MQLLLTVHTIDGPFILSFHSRFCSSHEHGLLIAQQHFLHFGPRHPLLLWASVKAGSFSSHLVTGQSRIRKVGICALSKLCPVLGLLKILNGTRPKAQQVVFLLGGDILTSPRCTLSVTGGSDIKVVWSSLHSRGSDSVNNQVRKLAEGFKHVCLFVSFYGLNNTSVHQTWSFALFDIMCWLLHSQFFPRELIPNQVGIARQLVQTV